MEQKFYQCEKCGKIVALVKESKAPTMCCGQAMKEIVPGTTDAAVEKHVPVYTVEGNKVHVTVGAVEHPMAEEHYIEWVSLQTKSGNQRKALQPGQEPKTCFALLKAIDTNPDSPYVSNSFYLKAKAQYFYEHFISAIGPILSAINDGELQKKFLGTYQKKCEKYRADAGITG